METVHKGRVRKLGVALFICSLFAPFPLFFALQTSSAEKARRLELRPARKVPSIPKSLSEIHDFPDLFEEAWNDLFPFKSELVATNSLARYGLRANNIYRSTRQEVLIGSDGWLFLATDHQVVDQFRGLDLLTEAELTSWVSALNRLDHFVLAKGGRFLFIVIPNKHSIYPEQLPRWVERGSVTQIDQVFARLDDLQTLNLLPILKESRPRESRDLYYSTDSHWNAMGSFVAFRALFQRLYPDRTTPGNDQLEIKERGSKGRLDLSRMLALDWFLKEQLFGVSLRDPPLIEDRIVLVHDSFGNAYTFHHLDDSVAQPVKRAHVTDLDGMVEAWTTLDGEIVILMVVERLLNGSAIPERISRSLDLVEREPTP